MPGILGGGQPTAVPQQPNALQRLFTPQRSLAFQGLGNILQGGTGAQAFQGLQQLQQSKAQERLQQEGQQLLSGVLGGGQAPSGPIGTPFNPAGSGRASPLAPTGTPPVVTTPISDDPIITGAADAIARSDPAADPSLSLIRQFEGFRENPYYDVNAFRAGYGSDTITTPEGRVVPVTQGARVSREDAERDLQRRVQTEFAPRARAAVGAQVYDQLNPQQQAALNSITYNYGSLPERVASVARTGDVNATAQAIAGLAGDNEGVNANRRQQEAQIFAGGAGTPQAGGQQPQASQISQDRVLQILNHPGIPNQTKQFVLGQFQQQQQAAQAAQQPQRFEITELADGRKYYVDPTGQTPARPVNPNAQPGDVADFETEQKLRKEFGGVSTVEDFYKVRDSFQRIGASAQDPSGAGDLALIFNYMKMLDPGSVVREGEFATAEQAGGVDEQVRNVYNRLITGERLQPHVREDFVNRAGLLFDAQAGGFNQVVGQYRALAEQYNLDPDRIAQKAERERKPPEQAAAELAEEEANGATAPLIGVGETTVIDGVTIERVN